ncbi:MAG: transcriptional regulator [Actinobacteria bacterium]|nr:transcriptional regulator [Actinomycetota bacterium]
METFTRKLVTIVTEALIEDKLTKELEQLGVHGFTVTDARGKGERGVRDAHHEFAANIRIEIICGEKIAEAIERHLVEHYFPNYAIIWFVSNVEILRADKFS